MKISRRAALVAARRRRRRCRHRRGRLRSGDLRKARTARAAHHRQGRPSRLAQLVGHSAFLSGAARLRPRRTKSSRKSARLRPRRSARWAPDTPSCRWCRPTARCCRSIRWRGLSRVDGDEVTVRAGTRLGDLGPALASHGRAMANLPDINKQSLGGALATATHGTGKHLPAIHGTVTALRLVTPQGLVIDCDATKNKDVFDAARVSLGALGIITQVRLKTIPNSNLHRRVWLETFEDTLAQAEERWNTHRNFEFYAVPFTGLAANITHDETDEAPRPRGPETDSQFLDALKMLRNCLRILDAAAQARRAFRADDGGTQGRGSRRRRLEAAVDGASRALQRDGIPHPGGGAARSVARSGRRDRREPAGRVLPDRSCAASRRTTRGCRHSRAASAARSRCIAITRTNTNSCSRSSNRSCAATAAGRIGAS